MLFDGSHRGVFLKYRLFSGFRWFKYSVAIKQRNRRKRAEILETKRDALPEIWQSGETVGEKPTVSFVKVSLFYYSPNIRE